VSPIADTALQSRIDALQAKSVAQEAETHRYFSERAKKGDLSWDGLDADANRFMADKLVALEPIKAEFCHLVCRSLGARRVVEVGTSYGVSTHYLAAAVRETGGMVIATEYEPAKAAAARANFEAAGIADLIDLREGDLRETLKALESPIDFVLMDIWTEMVVPAMQLITPHLRPGAVVIADNTTSFRHAYRHYFDFLAANGFSTLTLPFDGGLEYSVKL
jgi:predicted O-methyltransferase YrrM